MRTPYFRPGRRGLLLLFLLLCLGIGYFCIHQSPDPRTDIAPLSTNIPPNEVPWTDRYIFGYIPHSWGWLWRFKDYVSGPSRGVLIEAKFIELNNPPEALLNDLVKGGTELANTNGIRALGFTPKELKVLRQRLNKPSPSEEAYAKVVSNPSIKSADAVEATLSTSGSGTKENAFSIQVSTFPRVRNDATDLTSTILLTQPTSIGTKTNLAIWTKSRITNGCGLLLLDCHQDTNNKRMAVLISATLDSPKK